MKTFLKWLKRRQIRLAAEKMAQAKKEAEVWNRYKLENEYLVSKVAKIEGRVAKYEERVEQLMRQ